MGDPVGVRVMLPGGLPSCRRSDEVLRRKIVQAREESKHCVDQVRGEHFRELEIILWICDFLTGGSESGIDSILVSLYAQETPQVLKQGHRLSIRAYGINERVVCITCPPGM